MKMSTKILTFSPNVSLSVVGMSASELFKLFAFVLFPRSRELVLHAEKYSVEILSQSFVSLEHLGSEK